MQSVKPQNRRDGFTMLEVMIAITILAMVMGAIYATWMSILRSNAKADEVSAEVQQERIALRALGDALAGAVMDETNLDFYYFYSNNEALLGNEQMDYPEISFVSHLPPDYFGSARFAGQPMRRVTFRVEDGPGVLAKSMNQRRLVLEQRPLMALEYETNLVHRTVLADNLDLFYFDFLDGDVWSQEWAETNQVPKMIKVHLVLRREDSEGQRMELDESDIMRGRMFGFAGIPIINKDMRAVDPPQNVRAPVSSPPRGPGRGDGNNKGRQFDFSKLPKQVRDRIDTNKDGRIDEREAKAARDRFNQRRGQGNGSGRPSGGFGGGSGGGSKKGR